MELGYRVFNSGDISKFDLDFVQVSVWHKKMNDLGKIARICEDLSEIDMPFVVHVLGVYLSDTRPEREKSLAILREYARLSDLGIILHDETLPNGERLHGLWRENYVRGITELQGICKVSLENSHDSPNALWFWNEFADSITIDIGHFVSAGMDASAVIRAMTEDHLSKLEYIHVHKHNGIKPGGITDHWALEEGCVELSALKEVLDLKEDVKVVVEVDGYEELRRSIDLVSKLR